MKKIFRLLIIISILFFVLFTFLYLSFLFILPKIMTYNKTISVISEMIYKKSGIKTEINNLYINSYPDLTLKIYIGELSLNLNKKNILTGKNIESSICLLNKKIKFLSIDYMYAQTLSVKKIINNKKKRKTQFNIDYLPDLYIKNGEIILNEDNNTTKVFINNLKTTVCSDNFENRVITFNSELFSSLAKNKVKIENNNGIFVNKDEIKTENLNILFDKSPLNIKGSYNIKNKKFNLKILGSNVPVFDIENSVLYFMKKKSKKRIFLENFTNFSGKTDINIEIKNNGIFGKCRVAGLSADIEKFKIPVKFEPFYVYFFSNKIRAEAHGKIGEERVYTDFNMSGYSKKERIISGRVHSLLTDDFVQKYLPDFHITGGANANVRYYIKNSIPQITYIIKLREDSNLYFKNASLDMTDKVRRVFVRTKKEGDKLYITEYNYAFQEGTKISTILSGEGLFEKKQGKMLPQYITCKTEYEAPVSVTGSFGEKLDGGLFTGDLKYDFNKNLLTGKFNINGTKYKDFYVENASIKADDKDFNINAYGTYLDSDFSSSINMENRFEEKVVINDINLFLDKYEIRKGCEIKKSGTKSKIKIPKTVKQIDFTVKNGRIKVNKLTRNKILIENIEIIGSLKNNIVTFSIPEVFFAKGILQANGIYNIRNHSSVIDFRASDIDSNSVAYMIFNLPGQIQGKANATLKAETRDNLNYIKAKASFSIKNGYLPKLGSTEFIIKRSKKSKKPLKIRISDIINIDISKSKALMSDINGCFNIINYKLNDVEIYSKQKYLSMFIEGDYDIKKENGNLQLWGKYNKTQQRKVKILFIPLSVIMKIVFKPEDMVESYKNKIRLIPSIEATEEETEAFKVKLTGDLNKKDLKVELKSIKDD